jgi:hypothetical protein
MIPPMTRTRPVARTTSLALALALALSGTLLLAPPYAEAQAPVARQVSGTGDGGPNTYVSTPPDLFAKQAKPQPVRAAKPKPPPTRGTITGQVVGPGGTPIPNALVTGVRFSDLGLPVDLTEEKRVLARTDRAGRFTLKQLREPYLVRVCSESVSGGGGGHRARRSGQAAAGSGE